jgi:hypothetical protein
MMKRECKHGAKISWSCCHVIALMKSFLMRVKLRNLSQVVEMKGFDDLESMSPSIYLGSGEEVSRH